MARAWQCGARWVPGRPALSEPPFILATHDLGAFPNVVKHSSPPTIRPAMTATGDGTPPGAPRSDRPPPLFRYPVQNDSETNRRRPHHDQVLALHPSSPSQEFVPHVPHHSSALCIRCTWARVTVGRVAKTGGLGFLVAAFFSLLRAKICTGCSRLCRGRNSLHYARPCGQQGG